MFFFQFIVPFNVIHLKVGGNCDSGIMNCALSVPACAVAIVHALLILVLDGRMCNISAQADASVHSL